MAHVPHIHLPSPWPAGAIPLSADQRHHLDVVLRVRTGEVCSYTDGAGTIGSGVIGEEGVRRGEERTLPLPPSIDLAVAPPANKDRLRFLVEKAAELGARRVLWLATRYGQGRPPRADKARQWAVGALEQSRGSHLTVVDDHFTPLDRLSGPLVAADRGGSDPVPQAPVTLLVGPEGGWAPDELPPGIPIIDLGERVLRTETAALAGLCRLLWAR